MCIPQQPTINLPEAAALPKLPPPIAPPEKVAERLVVNPSAATVSSRRRAQRGLTPDLDALRIPLNLPRAGESTNLP